MGDSGNTTGGAGQQPSKAAKLAGQAKDKATAVAGEVAHRAAPLAGQAKDKATAVAGGVAHRAAPLAGQAKDKAADLAHKAGPIAAHGVESTATKLDQLTRGKYSQQIKSVSTRLEHVLDPAGHTEPQTAAQDGSEER